MLLFLLYTSILGVCSSDTISTAKSQIILQSRFEAPIDTHLIEILNNIPSLTMCAAVCERHSICRTADYNSAAKLCRLFETIVAAGTLLADQSTKVIAFNYCPNDQQIEPEYICTRSGTFTVQQMFDQLALATTLTLSSTDRGAYANLQGVYTSSTTGDLSFFTYNGVKTAQAQLSQEVTNVNSATRNGLVSVQYATKSAIIYTNTGAAWQPQLVQALNISLIYQPSFCLMTSQYLYITHRNNSVIMTVHNLTTGSILFPITSSYGKTYRPVIALWNDTLIVLDQYRAMEYALNGTYIGLWTYFSGPQSGTRHYVHHDYAGRRYICNGGGTNPGIYAFLLNGTQLALGPSSCYRAFQVYITKEQAMLINIPANATMQVIKF